MIAARTLATLETAAAQISAESGHSVRFVAADLTTSAGRDAALAACPAPDILVNNADGPLPGDFRDWTRDDWHQALDAMMLSPIEMMRLTVDGMIERGFGRIVNIVSRSVKTPRSARPVGRCPLRPGRLRRRPRAATVRTTSPSTTCCPVLSPPTRSDATSTSWSRPPANPSQHCGSGAAPTVQRDASDKPRKSARSVRSCVRRMRVTSPGRAF